MIGRHAAIVAIIVLWLYTNWYSIYVEWLYNMINDIIIMYY